MYYDLDRVRDKGPFFTFFIPVFYWFQGASWRDPVLLSSTVYVVLVSSFCESLSQSPGQCDGIVASCFLPRVLEMVFGIVPEPRKPAIRSNSVGLERADHRGDWWYGP